MGAATVEVCNKIFDIKTLLINQGNLSCPEGGLGRIKLKLVKETSIKVVKELMAESLPAMTARV